MRALLLFVGISLVLGSVAASAQQGQLPAGMTMHRIQAGTLDANGWTPANSTGGGFSLKIPCTFNDFMMDQSAANSIVLKSHTVGCLRQDQRKFSATRFQYRNGAKAAKEYFDRNASGEGWGKDAELKKLTFKGMPAVDVSVKNAERCGVLRYILLQADMIMMAVEAPVATCEGLKAQGMEFFGSLNVEAK
jgi:hypothetical protein